MRRIGELAELIECELSSAERYAKLALASKDSGNAAEARVFAEVANQGLGCCDKLHGLVTSAIASAKQDGAEVPEGMERVWDWAHARLVDKTASVRSLLQMLGL